MIIPSHQLAVSLLVIVHKFLAIFGLEHSVMAEQVVYFAVVLIIALLIGRLLQWVVLALLRRWVKFKKTTWGTELLRQHTLLKCCRIIPPLVLLALLPFAFNHASGWHVWVMRIVMVWALVAFALGVCAVFKFCWEHYDEHKNERHLPLKGIYDVCIGLVWIVIAILAVAVLLDKSPAMLLTGLGAFAAALMLIFKDSILGFVAGIQLSNNDMLRVGDWITVPGTPADGVVTDVNISVVKVQNFDNTMVMLPPYSLISSSFQNWRGMSDSGIRRIARNILVDAATIVTADDGTTNLTQYRAWVFNYLNSHPKLDHSGVGNSLTMVRLMAQEPAGVPMQIYCFTATTVWPDYEAIQSEVMEHVMAGAEQFKLTVYNYPSKIG